MFAADLDGQWTREGRPLPELANYTTGKGSIQFPHDAPLPRTLIAKIAKRRIRELRENDAKWM